MAGQGMGQRAARMRSGRRRGQPDTRAEILAAARKAFGRRGYDAATLREIARDAGVDPALIHHYFDTKERLFMETVHFPLDPFVYVEGVAQGDRGQLAERLLRTLLKVWDSPVGGSAIALIRTATQHDWSVRLLRDFLFSRVLWPLLRPLETDEAVARWRANLVASQIAGLAMTRYILKIEPLASAPHDVIVAALAPTVQRYLCGDVPPPPAASSSSSTNGDAAPEGR